MTRCPKLPQPLGAHAWPTKVAHMRSVGTACRGARLCHDAPLWFALAQSPGL